MARISNAAVSAGQWAEEDARWHIDRTFHGGKNWKILHDVVLADLRANCWCQIDHLIFGRMGHFLVTETKSAVNGMKLHKESGAFSIIYNGQQKPIKSPIAQNLRHIQVLGDFLKKEKIMPRRFLIPIRPTFENWILVQPGVPLPKKYGGARLVQRDQFDQEIDIFIDQTPSLTDILKIMSRSEVAEIARRIEEESKENKRIRDNAAPAEVPTPPTTSAAIDEEDYAPKPPEISAERYIGTRRRIISSAPSQPRPSTQPQRSCEACQGPMTSKEVSFCRFNFAKLGRRYLCQPCQRNR